MNTGRPLLEVADLIRLRGHDLSCSRRLSGDQRQVMRDIATCRTAALGGHVDECDGCGHQQPSYNSCRNRHCPKCQGKERARWLDQRLARLLPAPYFHVVFTLPAEIGPVVLRNKRLGYKILFEAAAQTILTLAADPQRLGAQVAITAVLHSWGQNLLFHPHLHCVVSGGGLTPDGRRWIDGSDRFFLPVRVLARMFRGKYLAALDEAHRAGHVDLADGTAGDWPQLRDQLYKKDWIVFAKPPFGGPEQVFRYLGRYTHRVAISNHRLVRTDGRTVTFKVKDYADHGRTKQLTLEIERFLGRFLLHVLPRRFVRIRHYGLVAGRNVSTRLQTARRLIASRATDCQRTRPRLPAWSQRLSQELGNTWGVCPECGQQLIRRQRILPESPQRCMENLVRGSPRTAGAAS